MWGVRLALPFIKNYWVLAAAGLSAVGLVVGWARFRLSPLQALEERAHKQDAYRRLDEQNSYRRRMVDRHLELGDVFLDSSLLGAAEQELRQALVLDPTNVKAQFGLLKADVFKPISDREPEPLVSESRLKFILKEDPDDKHALLYLGILYTTIDADEARTYLQRALAQDPRLAVAYVNLGFICDMTGDPEQAMQMYEKALQLTGWQQNALNNISYHYIRQGRFEEAVKKLTLLLHLDGDALIAYWNLSNALRFLGQHEVAYLHLKQVHRLMENQETLDHKDNRGPWFFETAADGSGKGVLFVDPAQKKAYTLFSLAFSCHLTDRPREAKSMLSHAAELACDEPQPALEFVRANMRRLTELYPDLTQAVHCFEKMISQAGVENADRERWSVAPMANTQPDANPERQIFRWPRRARPPA